MIKYYEEISVDLIISYANERRTNQEKGMEEEKEWIEKEENNTLQQNQWKKINKFSIYRVDMRNENKNENNNKKHKISR